MQGVFDVIWHCVGESQRKKINTPKEYRWKINCSISREKKLKKSKARPDCMISHECLVVGGYCSMYLSVFFFSIRSTSEECIFARMIVFDFALQVQYLSGLHHSQVTSSIIPTT